MEIKKNSNYKLIVLLFVSVLLILSGLFIYLKNGHFFAENNNTKKETIKCVDENLIYNLDGLELQNVTEGGYENGLGEFEFDLVNTSSEVINGGIIKIVPDCSIDNPIFIKYSDLPPGSREHYLAQYKLEATAHSKKFGLSYLTDEELKQQEELYSE